ncbi:MAG TPA: class I SAM-dependent methyltransferase [Longimicrobium sp.]|jgi:SAM-dependent methyltransferase
MRNLADLYVASDSYPAHIVEFLRALASAYELPQPLHVLDAGCGPGRLLAPLDRLRWQVTGMEPHPDFVASARTISQFRRRVSVLQGGFLDIDQDAEFDLAIGVNSSFAHLVTPAERADALRRIHRALKPGGVVFLDLPNFLWILKNHVPPQPYTFEVQGETVTLNRSQDIDFHAATFITTDEYVYARSGQSEARLVHSYGMTTLPDLQHHLDAAGFDDARTFNSYAARTPERLDGPRILLAARKPLA